MPKKLRSNFMGHNIDSTKIAEILKECSDKYILPRYRNLQEGDIQTKSHANDFVTIADTETEEALCQILPKIYPGCIVIGEEGVSSSRMTTDALKDKDQVVFIVDPVDGTYNFKNGNPEFAVMMALVVGGETRMGWIYDVVGDAHMIVEKGAGAFLSGKRLQVAAPKPADQCLGYVKKSYFPKELQAHMGYVKDAGKAFRDITSLNCAAHEYLRVASGRADFSIYGWMKPWDHLTGVLMVQEAGGIAAKWDRTLYVPTDNRGGLLIASNQGLWDESRAKFLQPALDKLQLKP